MKILFVEDDVQLASSLVQGLGSMGFAVDLADRGELASELMYLNEYDAVILDWGIPPPTGIELVRSWREEGRSTPVLMLTGRSSSEAIVSGLDAGADDYLTKPFRVQELMARLRSLLRRRDKPVCLKLRAADLELDPAKHTVTVDGDGVTLTPKEFALLEYLLTRSDEVVSRSEIQEHVWDSAMDSFSNFVDVTVHRLRKKIDDGRQGRLLHSVRGEGFVLRSQRS